MVGSSGIAEGTKNMASAWVRCPWGGQGAKVTDCPVAWLSGSIAPAKKKKPICIHTHRAWLEGPPSAKARQRQSRFGGEFNVSSAWAAHLQGGGEGSLAGAGAGRLCRR